MLLDREHSMTLHACDVFVFFFASSTKTSPFILHTESVRICTCTCTNVRRRILKTLVFVSVFRAYAHTQPQTLSYWPHSPFQRFDRLFCFCSLVLFCYRISPIMQSLIASLSLVVSFFTLNVFLSSIILCTLCATLYLNSNYHNATMQRFFPSLLSLSLVFRCCVFIV